jgi:hypothetical protein
MQGFSGSFLIFFYQLAFGGLLALSATPFHELDRIFYKSTGAVLFLTALFGLWGKSQLYWENFTRQLTLLNLAEAFLHFTFIASLAGYLFSLWGDNQRFRARSFALAILTGLAGLFASAQGFFDAPLLSVETVIYPVSFFCSSLLLGGVTVGMLIGHWYLIDTGQSLDPFIRVYKFFVTALVAQALFVVLAFPVVYFLGSAQSAIAIENLWMNHFILLSARLLVGQWAPLILSWMISRTLLIPHTMAATGLFYIALLGVFVGEILGRQILAVTSLPL